MVTRVNIRCPSCQGPLAPVKLRCASCDISVSGRFVANEFASLSEDDLHFLRIFVVCEGHIKEMESALGVSYPTIKARLAKLKETLQATASQTLAGAPGMVPGSAAPATAAVLRDLEAGRITYEQAMARLRQVQKEGKEK